MCKESETDNKLLHDFHLLDTWGQQAVIETVRQQLERCIAQDKEIRKESFQVIK